MCKGIVFVLVINVKSFKIDLFLFDFVFNYLVITVNLEYFTVLHIYFKEFRYVFDWCVCERLWERMFLSDSVSGDSMRPRKTTVLIIIIIFDVVFCLK